LQYKDQEVQPAGGLLDASLAVGTD
jgi:hypothetical protein